MVQCVSVCAAHATQSIYFTYNVYTFYVLSRASKKKEINVDLSFCLSRVLNSY